MARKAKETKAGRVSMHDLMSLVNKKAGRNVAHDLTGENPTEVKEWIPTGSRWLDSIVCKGRVAGNSLSEKLQRSLALKAQVSPIWLRRLQLTPRRQVN